MNYSIASSGQTKTYRQFLKNRRARSNALQITMLVAIMYQLIRLSLTRRALPMQDRLYQGLLTLIYQKLTVEYGAVTPACNPAFGQTLVGKVMQIPYQKKRVMMRQTKLQEKKTTLFTQMEVRQLYKIRKYSPMLVGKCQKRRMIKTTK